MMDSREQFEEWASSPEFGLSQAYFLKDDEGEYINYPTQCYWVVWQAADSRSKSTENEHLKFALEVIISEGLGGQAIARLALEDIKCLKEG